MAEPAAVWGHVGSWLCCNPAVQEEMSSLSNVEGGLRLKAKKWQYWHLWVQELGYF